MVCPCNIPAPKNMVNWHLEGFQATLTICDIFSCIPSMFKTDEVNELILAVENPWQKSLCGHPVSLLVICRVFAYAMNLILPTSPLVFQLALPWVPRSWMHCNHLPQSWSKSQGQTMLYLQPQCHQVRPEHYISHNVPQEQRSMVERQKKSNFVGCFKLLQHPVCPIKSADSCDLSQSPNKAKTILQLA